MPGVLGMISFESMRNTFTCYIFVFVLSRLYIRIIIIEVADARRHAHITFRRACAVVWDTLTRS